MDPAKAPISQSETRPVLVVRLPVDEFVVDGLSKVRTYILESLMLGALVLPDRAAYCVEQFPAPLQEAAVLAPVPEREEPPLLRSRDAPAAIAAAEAAEKRDILQRLQSYRAAGGLGCLDKLAKAIPKYRNNPAITDNTLRAALNGEAVLDIKDWRRIGRGLEKVVGSGT